MSGRFVLVHRALRGTCRCGRDLVIAVGITADRPRICGCYRRWYEQAGEAVELLRIAPALCLDLDGTVRASKSGASYGPVSPADVELLPGVETRVAAYKNAGWFVVGVTNQGVVAYGTRTEVEVETIVLATRRLFDVDPFDLVLASYSVEGGTVPGRGMRSLLRKPAPGMLALAEVKAQTLGVVIDWNRSLMVGDRNEDKACAEAAGVAFQWAAHFFAAETEER